MREDICKHYNGLVFGQHGNCDAGVAVRDRVGGEDFGWAKRMPCMRRNSDVAFDCPKREFPTTDEVAESEAEWNRLLKSVGQARRAIIDGGATKNSTGHIDCPVCSGQLNWTMAFNGHIHAKCETENCLAWME